MKTFLLVSFLLISIIPKSCFGQNFTFEEIKADSIKSSITKVLIVGMGSIETRQFFESLSAKITEKFKIKNINSEGRFLGRDPKEANDEIKKLLTQNFDAIFVISPKDSALFLIDNYNSESGGEINITTNIRSVLYSQSFFLLLYELSDNKNLIWKALLTVGLNPAKKGVYSNITKKIFSSLKEHAVIK